MKHVVSLSGGKDSTAMLLMMLEKNMPIDYIIFCDTGKEFPQMYEHLDKLQKRIGRDITFLRAEKSFDYYFSEHVKTKGKHIGEQGYGWATMRIRWCTSILKQSVLNKFYRSIKDDYMEYVGIAYDEPKRIKDKNYPLYDWKITEAEALKYCYDKGFDWGGLYEHFKRVSCWCCPLKSIPELRMLYRYYPQLWQELLYMDSISPNQFRSDYSVKQLDERFRREEISLFE